MNRMVRLKGPPAELFEKEDLAKNWPKDSQLSYSF
jgi:hypothetical protein